MFRDRVRIRRKSLKGLGLNDVRVRLKKTLTKQGLGKGLGLG